MLINCSRVRVDVEVIIAMNKIYLNARLKILLQQQINFLKCRNVSECKTKSVNQYINNSDVVAHNGSVRNTNKVNETKPYESIPGPRGPFGIGNIFKYLPFVGKYSWLELHKASYDKYKEYGPIVKETMVPGQDIIWLYDPKDIALLLNSKTYPLRRSHLALAHYRSKRPNVYRSAGLLAT